MPEATLRHDDSGPVLSNGHLVFAAHLNKGTFSLADAKRGLVVLSDAAAVARLSTGPTLTSRGSGFTNESNSPVEDLLGRGLSVTLTRETEEQEPDLSLTVTLYEDQPFAAIQAELRNSGPANLQVSAFHVLDGARVDLGSPPETWRFYKHGWQSWSPTLVLDCRGEDVPMPAPVVAPGTQPEARGGRFVSELMTVIASAETGSALVAGFVTAADQLSQLWLDCDSQKLTAASYADGITISPGGRLSSERLLLEPTISPLESMERYGDALGEMMGAAPPAEIASGWCSWYYYWQGVREGHIVANLEELARRREELPLEYVQIDDGWQAGIGDWLTVNEKFPHGLKWLVDQIHARGHKAGLWLAPFLMGANSSLYHERPDWAVEYQPGKPFIAMLNWGQDCYALDLTMPEVIEWLREVFSTICGSWGFDYVKIDFIYAGAVDGIRHDPNVTRAQAYRRGLAAIREAVGERFVLACGNPIGPSIGLVDGARIGPDVAPYWRPAGASPQTARSHMSEPSCLNAIRNAITRWWMHGRLWQNDPDCLLARESETALSPDEVRTLATVIAMSGGMVLNSDDLTRLAEDRRRLMSMSLPPYGKAARPLDLFEADIPCILQLDCGGHTMIAVFNWDDAPASVRAPLPASPSHVFDVWGQTHLGARKDGIDVELRAHACALLAVTQAEEEASRTAVNDSGGPALLFPKPQS